MAAKIEPILTIADLDATPDDGNRYELIEGELYVSRAPGLKHQRILSNIDRIFGKYLEHNAVGEAILNPGVIFSEYSSVIPDLVYISNERRAEIASGDRIEGPPDLIVEILSPGAENRKRDRQIKRQLYGKHGVKEYWAVDPEYHVIEIYRKAHRASKLTLASTLGIEDTLASPLLPGFQCPVRDIF